MKPRAERKNKWMWLFTNLDVRYLTATFILLAFLDVY